MLIRQTLLYLPAQVLGPLVQLAAMVVWTHFLAPAEMGVFALIVAAQELIYTATLFWFSLATVRYHDHGDTTGVRERFLSSESAVLIGSAAAAFICVLLLPLFVGETRWSVALIGVTTLYTITRGMVAHLSDRARAEHDTLSYSLMQISWPVLGFATGLLFVSIFEANTLWVLAGYVVGQTLALVIAALRMKFGFDFARIERRIVGQALRYGMPLVAGAILVWVAQNSIRFIVEWQEGAAAVGLITVGWGLGLRVSAFASMLVTAAAFPLAVKKSRETGLDDGQVQLQQNGLLLLAALAPACVGLWLVSDAFVELAVAGPFQDITKAVLPWAILAGAVRNLRLHFGEQVFLLRERTFVPLTNDMIDAVLATIGTIAGLAWGGLEGAVIGGAIGAMASAAVTLAWAAVAHAFTLPLRDSLKIGAATVLMAVAVTLITGSGSALHLTGAIALGAAIYALGIGLFFPEFRHAGAALLRHPTTQSTTTDKVVRQDQ